MPRHLLYLNGLMVNHAPLGILTDGLAIVEHGLIHFTYLCLVMGLCAFLGLFALAQNLYSRDLTYRYWAFYLWSNGLLLFTATDFSFRLGWVGSTHRPWSSVAQYFIQLTYLLFLQSFLEIKSHYPSLLPFFRRLIWLILVGMLYTSWAVTEYGQLRGVLDYGDGFTFVTDLLILLLFVRIVRMRIPQTRLLMIGSLGVLTTAVLAAGIDLFNFTHIDGYWVDPVVLLFSVGILFELTFFSLALSERTRLIQLENQWLQQNYTRQLEQELAQRITTIQEQNQLLENERLQRLTQDFNQKVAEVEMAALRAQMNPHFIFNCLNSIQFYTAQNNTDKASEYLTKFSRLIRLVLENSKSEKVTLTNELETLRLYMDMESMRFPQKLSYAIQVSETIEVDAVQIPPLLLQPFVENAIWHGLMHKEEGGRVEVLVEQPQDHLLRVIISDDGVGRARAAEYKSKSATRQKSFGMKITADRIALIDQLYDINTQVIVHDLIDEHGMPAGTQVIIEIPT